MKHELTAPVFTRADARGTFQELLNTGTWKAVLHGRMNSGSVMGNHYHKITEVFFFLLSGEARIHTVHVETEAKDQFVLQPNQGVLLRTYESHAILFLKNSEFLMLKSLAFDAANPDTFHHQVVVD